MPWRGLRTPGPGELVAAAAGLAVFGYVGWDGALWDPRFQLLLHLLAVGAVGALAVIALRGGDLPRTRLDLALMLVLGAVAAATASALNPGLSLRSMAVISATAAMLPVALVVLRARPTLSALVVCLPILGLAIGSLSGMVVRRVAWYLAGGPGPLPPIRMPNEGTPFGSVAVAPFVILAALPLTVLIEPRWLRRTLQVGLVAAGIPLALLSGSRSAWLAIVVATVAFGAVALARGRVRLRLPERLTVRTAAGGLAVTLVAALVIAIAAPRLTAVTSLVYRGNLWRDTLAAWSTDPLLGLGPGVMPFARAAAAEPLSFPAHQPHSHNLVLGVLGDAGLVGLVAAIALLVAFLWRAGPWRSRTWAGRAAGAALIGWGAGGLFEDITFTPAASLLVVILAAMAIADAGAVVWRPLRLNPLRRVRDGAIVLAAAGAGAVLLAASAVADAGAIAYRNGTDAAWAGDWEAATEALETAVQIDPWHPAGPKSLAIAADAAGDAGRARSAAERAVELSPGDGASWANLALLCMRAEDRACADEAARQAVDNATLFGLELANAALVLDALGDTQAADDAYRLSLLTNRLTSFGLRWPRPVEVAPDPRVDELDLQSRELGLVIALHSQMEPIDHAAVTDPAVAALAWAIDGEREPASIALEAAQDARPAEALTWDLTVVLRHHWDEPYDDALRVVEIVRDGPLPPPGARPGRSRLSFDVVTFRAYPLDGLLDGAERLTADRAYPWLLEAALP